jgi:hypothetical protein
MRGLQLAEGLAEARGRRARTGSGKLDAEQGERRSRGRGRAASAIAPIATAAATSTSIVGNPATGMSAPIAAGAAIEVTAPTTSATVKPSAGRSGTTCAVQMASSDEPTMNPVPNRSADNRVSVSDVRPTPSRTSAQLTTNRLVTPTAGVLTARVIRPVRNATSPPAPMRANSSGSVEAANPPLRAVSLA